MGMEADDINVDEVLDRAEQEEQLSLVQSVSEGRATNGDQHSPLEPRRIDNELDKVDEQQQPQQQQQQQQPQPQLAASSSTTMMGQPGYVLQEAQKYEPKTLAQVEEERRQNTALSTTHAGKRAQQIPVDPMQTAKGDLFTLALRVENAQLRAQLAQVETIMNTLQTPNAMKTPKMHNIATPTLKLDNEKIPINFDVIDNADEAPKDAINKKVIQNGVLFNGAPSPSEDGSAPTSGETGALFQMGRDGGAGGGYGGPPDDEDEYDSANMNKSNQYREVTLVSPNKIVIQTFSGNNLNSKPYLPFNKSIRKLIKAQGRNGLVLLQILDYVEKYGPKLFTNTKLAALVEQCPRAVEYNVAIQNVLGNYTSDVAEGMVRYGVCNGFDAWRRLYHYYIPLSQDLQQILIQELYDLKLVGENEVDKLFNDIQRISELYVRAGDENIPEQWLVAAVKRNLPIKMATELSMELRKLQTVDEIHNAINIYRHDHRTGLPRGVPGTMLAMIEKPPEAAATTLTPKEDESATNITSRPNKEPPTDKEQEDRYAATRGGKGNGKGGKGYGQCWECGEWGHPRRECPKFVARMEGKGSDLAALKGLGKKGKGGKGKGFKGGKGKWNGRGNYSYKYNNQFQRSPGKAIGKGLNNFDADYWNAWGSDNNDYWSGDNENWWGEDWTPGSGMNLMMMLERGGEEIVNESIKIAKTVKETKQNKKPETKTTGEFDPLRNAKQVEPISLQVSSPS